MALNFLFKLSAIPSSIGGLFMIYKVYFAVPSYKGDEDLTGKIAVVTGASSGIGQEIAYQLAKRNAMVVMACRDKQACRAKRAKIFEKTNNSQIFCAELDFDDFESVRSFARRLRQRVDRVDILVNNIGVKCGKKRDVVPGTFMERQLQVNVLAPFLLTELLLSLMTTSPAAAPATTSQEPARVVTMLCGQYAHGHLQLDDVNCEQNYDREKAFARSQLMRLLLTRYWAASDTAGLQFSVVNPGMTLSGFHDKEAYTGNFVSRSLFRYLNLLLMRNIWQAAQTPLMLCCTRDPVSSDGIYIDLQLTTVPDSPPDAGQLVHRFCSLWTRPAASHSSLPGPASPS